MKSADVRQTYELNLTSTEPKLVEAAQRLEAQSSDDGQRMSARCSGVCHSAFVRFVVLFGGAFIAPSSRSARPRPLSVSSFIRDRARQLFEHEMPEVA